MARCVIFDPAHHQRTLPAKFCQSAQVWSTGGAVPGGFCGRLQCAEISTTWVWVGLTRWFSSTYGGPTIMKTQKVRYSFGYATKGIWCRKKVLLFIDLAGKFRTLSLPHNRQVPCSSQGGATIFKGFQPQSLPNKLLLLYE